MAHHRTAAAIISIGVALVTLSACSSNSHQTSLPTSNQSSAPPTDPNTASSATTAPPSGSTTTTVLGPTGSPATYPAAQATPPSLAGAYPTGQTVNLMTVLKTLATYRDWVWSHPNPALVATYILPSSPDYANEVKTLTEFQRDRLHADPTPTEIMYVRVTEPSAPQHIGTKYLKLGNYQAFSGGLVVAVYDINPVPLLTASGKPSGQEFKPTQIGEIPSSISLSQGLDGRFRFAQTIVLNPPGGVAAIEHSSS
jgi:hypothetical protein